MLNHEPVGIRELGLREALVLAAVTLRSKPSANVRGEVPTRLITAKKLVIRLQDVLAFPETGWVIGAHCNQVFTQLMDQELDILGNKTGT